jgi:hypothetical protein
MQVTAEAAALLLAGGDWPLRDRCGSAVGRTMKHHPVDKELDQ